MRRAPSHPIKQLTLRGLDPELQDKVRRLAQREGLSLNQAVVRFARKGAGLDRPANDDIVGDSLDRFIGGWSDRDVRQMAEAVGLLDEMDAASR